MLFEATLSAEHRESAYNQVRKPDQATERTDALASIPGTVDQRSGAHFQRDGTTG